MILKKKYTLGVSLPVYNHEFCIKRVIQAILDQDYEDIIIYIGDDCSSDNTFKIVTEYCSKFENIICYQNEQNLGVIDNCNKLIDFIDERNEIDLLCFIGGDDIMLPGKISKQVSIFDSTGINYICHDYKVVDLINGKELGEKKHKNREVCNLRETICNGLPSITSMINFNKIGTLRHSSTKSGTDLYLHWKYILSCGAETYYIPETLLIYGRTYNNVNASNFDKEVKREKTLNLRKNNFMIIFKLFSEYPSYLFFKFTINNFLYYIKGYFHKR